jgi:hypothetical protein
MGLKDKYRKAVSKINLFAAFQAAAGGFLTLSGIFANSAGRTQTGIFVTVRNALWVGANRYFKGAKGTDLQRDIWEARSNTVFSGLASLAYMPELIHGLSDVNNIMNVDTTAGFTGVVGFFLMTMGKYEEQRSLGQFQKENPNVKSVTQEQKDDILEYTGSKALCKDVAFNWAPSSFLVAKGLFFTGYAVNDLVVICAQANPVLGEVLGGISLLLCGGIFTWSAIKELQSENKVLRPPSNKSGHGNTPDALPTPKV